MQHFLPVNHKEENSALDLITKIAYKLICLSITNLTHNLNILWIIITIK